MEQAAPLTTPLSTQLGATHAPPTSRKVNVATPTDVQYPKGDGGGMSTPTHNHCSFWTARTDCRLPILVLQAHRVSMSGGSSLVTCGHRHRHYCESGREPLGGLPEIYARFHCHSACSLSTLLTCSRRATCGKCKKGISLGNNRRHEPGIFAL